ncbi:hypothetical protein [Algoriphagus sp. CAU 1675]|uniref:hypothetical protein n=1 Tax=Algoriphagus sp. CAU 1675 TaxID=3032597 RepID=UPI0023DB1341|nr:hypothetical protein [Algoriphagus sp. CAU 1675]MDF2159423.1 hypothetical protein [Algoriphagus sp. CAU 1675]
MKFISILVLSTLIVVFVSPFLTYWMIMVLLGILSFVLKPGKWAAFWGGGLGMGLSWLGQSYYLSASTGSALPAQMADLMQLGSSIYLFIITGVLGFLLGALASLSGALLRNLLKRKPNNIYKGTIY